MSRYLKLIALAGIVALVAVACGGDGGGGGGEAEQPGAQPQRGGTFETQLESDVSAAFDPQKEYYSVTWGLYHCCLLRTLVTTPGLPAEEGGNDLQPDLAAEMPTVSEDNLTWTFTLKDNVKYAPPLDDMTVKAEDFVRALEREACSKCNTGGYSFYYSIIEGFDDFAEGNADSISGLNAPDDTTLEVTTTEPAGDLGYRFAMPATAPIPPHPDKPNAEFGVATGHDEDYGRFLATTGPYMFEGQDQLDYSKPPKQQEPISGYQPGQSIRFVRNPAWDPQTDPTRPSYVDEFNISIGGTADDILNKVDAGSLDINLDAHPPAQFLREYSTDQQKKSRMHTNYTDGVYYLSFNVAMPPFDDVNVRKAVNLVIDKEGLRRIRGGPLTGDIATHAIPDTLLTVDGQSVLQGYNPYPGPDLSAAKNAMMQSEYDTDQDGVCDAPECKGVLAVTDEADPYPDQAELIRDNLQGLGIELDVKSGERTTFMYDKCNDPAAKVAFCLGPGWFKDYPDGYTWTPLFDSSGIFPSCCNYSLTGASSDLLREHDYEVTEVPSVDQKADECAPLTGDERVQCWGEYDRLVMEEAVPWVPYLFATDTFIVSERVQNYVFDSFAGQPALARIALAGGGAES